MLAAVVAWSLRHRLAVVVAWSAVAVAGVLAFLRLPLDAFPDTTPVLVQVNTVAPALSPLETERQLTMPVEQALSGLRGLREVRSSSKFGLSQVTARFADDADVYAARQLVAERLATVALPAGIERPTLGPVATGLGEVFHYLVLGARSLADLRTIQDWTIAPQLRSLPGVAEVNTWGGDERRLDVVVDPVALMRHDLSLAQLLAALADNNLNVGGGVMEAAGEAALVQGVGLVRGAEDVASIVVAARDGVPVTVRDVARVQEGRGIRRGAVTADGRGEVVLGLGFTATGENGRDVARRLAARLVEIRKTLPPGVRAEVVYDRTTLVDRVLRTVATNLLEGALLVIAVLFAFLGSVRAGLIVATAIPLSMLFAFDLMTRFGVAGSLMSLGAIDFGLVVDSSVVQVENAARRLAGDRSERPAADVVHDAALEVRRPTMFGELIILIVYLPILALEGIEGKLFRPMALTVVFALLGSLALSLTLIPALSSVFLKRTTAVRETLVVRLARRAYAPVLRAAIAHKGLVVAAAALLVANAALLASRLGSELVPRLREGAIVVNTVRLASVSLDESVRYGLRIEQLLLAAFPDEIERAWTRTGTAEIATDPMGIELSDVFVTLRDRAHWRRAGTQDELVVRIEEALAGLPGMRVVMTQPIEMRVNEMVTGVRADVGVKVFGDDLVDLRRAGLAVERILKGVPGAADVSVEQATGAPVVQVEVDRAAVARHGISAREVLDVVAALGGIEVGQVHEGERRFPIAVTLDERFARSPDALARVLVAAENGDRVPLGALATIRTVEGPSTVQREWGKRRIVVQANVRDRDVGGFVAEAKARIDAELSLPQGYFVRFGGQYEHLVDAARRLAVVVPLALLLVFVLLYFTYGRVVDALRVFTGVPFAAVGGVAALWLRDMPFSVSAAVGFVALSGVAVLGDMLLVSSIQAHRAQGFAPTDAVVAAAHQRLRPVLMTSLVASVGFLPMMLNTGIGAEVQRPLATVVVGGVLSSTLLTLVVLPVLYLLAGRDRAAPERPS